MLARVVNLCFVGTWIILGVTGFILFYVRKDAAFKRKWFPHYVALVGTLFVLFVTTLAVISSGSVRGTRTLFLLVPAILVISYLNLRFTKFCDKCGATILDQNLFSPTRFCPKCGAQLGTKGKFDADGLE